MVSTRTRGGAKTPKTAAGKAPAAGRRRGGTTSKSKPQARGAATAPPAARPSTGTNKKKAQVVEDIEESEEELEPVDLNDRLAELDGAQQGEGGEGGEDGEEGEDGGSEDEEGEEGEEGEEESSEGSGSEEESSRDDEDDEDMVARVAASMAARLSQGFRPSTSGHGAARVGGAGAGVKAALTVEDMAEMERLASFKWEPDTGLPDPHEVEGQVQWEVTRRSAVGMAPGQQAQRVLAAGKKGAGQKAADRALATTQADLAKSLYVKDKKELAKEARKEKKVTAGKKWYDLPAPKMTPDLKRDLKLLKLRHAYDPKRFYKTADTTKLPKFFAIGEVVSGHQEYYSSRLTKKERKRTITDELLSDDMIHQFRKRKVRGIQAEREGWAKTRKKNHQSSSLEYTKRRAGKFKH